MVTSYRKRMKVCHWNIICFLILITLTHVNKTFSSEYLAYVGTYTGHGSEGIYSFHFNPATGELTPIVLAASSENPSFLAVDPHGRYLYAVNELDAFQDQPTGAISVFAID